MSSFGKDAMAFKLVLMLTTPFNETNAFKLGIIDERGKVIKEAKTQEEHDAYSSLDRMVFSLKRLIEKVPGGKSKLGSIAAAYWLVKEDSENVDLDRFQKILEMNVSFLQEELEVKRILEDIAANNTAGVEVNNPNAVPKRLQKKTLKDLMKRKPLVILDK